MSHPVYITTPLYYVNAAPHIGHSYTTVAADALARYHRLKGDEVFLLTGTDEHGEKISQSAQAKALAPQVFVDQASQTFRELWTLLNIRYDHFIRTTDADHVRVVQRVLERLKPDLKRGAYAFWYCVPCETQFGLSEINAASPVCLNCGRPVSRIEEEDYYLPLEPHRDWLTRYIEEHGTFILPIERRNEVLGLLNHPLPDLCVTRPKERVPWGIEVPFSPAHVTYVWFDALINYISALGWPDDPRFARYWREAGAMHLIGKDILRHHGLYWPIILRALGVEPPKTIFAHGWWKIGEQKMSKSLGNIVDPTAVVGGLLNGQPYATDVYRYFLLREVPFGQDGGFSEEAIFIRLDADLANDLGNLVNRTLSMISRYTAGVIPQAPGQNEINVIDGGRALYDRAVGDSNQNWPGLSIEVGRAIERLEFSMALDFIMQFVTQTNQYIERTAPWQLAKRGHEDALKSVLGTLGEVIRIVSILIEPFMPSVSSAMWQQLGCGDQPHRWQDAQAWPGLPAGQAVQPGPVLFPRHEVKTPS